jgi:hypothetical protein
VANDQGRLVLVTELADLTLRDRFEECWGQGRTGLPRAELLRFLQSAAEALDYLSEYHALQHLCLNPRNLLIKENRLLVSDFGMVQLLWIPAGQPVAKINPRYAAPEIFDGRLSAHSDQYSLALIYQEMLTGHLPQRGHSSRQLAEARLQGLINLDDLPAADRGSVRRALAVDPHERFPTCAAFLSSLTDANRDGSRPPPSSTQVLSLETATAPVAARGMSPEQIITQLVTSATSSLAIQEFGGLRYYYTPDGVWQHKCAAWLAEGVAGHKLNAFLKRWNADVVHFDASSLVFRLDLGSNFWQRLLSRRQHVLEVSIGLGRTRPVASRLTEVTMRMRFLKGDNASQRRLLDQVGPIIAEELHASLLVTRERRIHERFAFDRPLCVAPAVMGGKGLKLECVGKDISYTGIGFYTSTEPPASQVFITSTSTADQAPFAIPAAVTRVQRTEEGFYEAGARFLVNVASPG